MTLTATGAAQTPLEGNALASGCTGCDGQAIYATISEVLTDANWYDDLLGLVVEDGDFDLAKSATKTLAVYAYYKNGTPRRIDNVNLAFTSDSTGIATVGANTGVVTGVAAGTAKISVASPNGITTSVEVTVAE